MRCAFQTTYRNPLHNSTLSCYRQVKSVLLRVDLVVVNKKVICVEHNEDVRHGVRSGDSVEVHSDSAHEQNTCGGWRWGIYLIGTSWHS